jgi:polyisoprenoid-binding protein YceI
VNGLTRSLAAATLCALIAACGAPTNDPSTAAPTPASVAAPETKPEGATASQASSASASAGAVTLLLDSTASRASYHAQEQLVGRNLPSEAVGTSNAVSGTIVIDPDGSIDADQSKINVDLSKLTSDESRRDNFIRGNTLQTSRFPMATFVPRSVAGLPSPLPTSGQATFQLSGDLTVHGVTRPVTWQVTAQFDSATVSGNATTGVNISDFGMTPPKAGPVLAIQDGLTLELIFSASRQAA